MAVLQGLKGPIGKVYTVKLPEQEYRGENSMVSFRAWGEVSPAEWQRFAKLAEAVPPIFCRSRRTRWNQLQAENAPLRASINGQLLSVPEDFYDSFILREIEAEKGEFQEANLIGRVMGKYRVGLGDGWIASRIEKIVNEGRLEIVTPAEKDTPHYCRVLRKRKIQD